MPNLSKGLNLPKLQPISTDGLDMGPEGGAAGPKVKEKKEEKINFDVKLEKFDAALRR